MRLRVDCVDIYEEDVDSLHPGRLLRSNIIEFYTSCLVDRYAESLATSGCRTLMVPLSVVFAVCAFRDAALLGAVERLEEVKCVLLPMADFTNGGRSGNGDHYSLLCLLRNGSAEPFVAYHCDSISTRNLSIAQDACRVLAGAFRVTEGVATASSFPQQRNGYDCGLYVCFGAERICEELQHRGPGGAAALLTQAESGLWFDAAAVELDGRKQIAALLESYQVQ